MSQVQGKLCRGRTGQYNRSLPLLCNTLSGYATHSIKLGGGRRVKQNSLTAPPRRLLVAFPSRGQASSCPPPGAAQRAPRTRVPPRRPAPEDTETPQPVSCHRHTAAGRRPRARRGTCPAAEGPPLMPRSSPFDPERTHGGSATRSRPPGDKARTRTTAVTLPGGPF